MAIPEKVRRGADETAAVTGDEARQRVLVAGTATGYPLPFLGGRFGGGECGGPLNVGHGARECHFTVHDVGKFFESSRTVHFLAMPVPWLPVDAFGTLRAGAPVIQRAPSAQVAVDDELVVNSELNRYDPIGDVFTFEKGVVARYGPTTLYAEHLTVDRRNKRAKATGNVRIIDPEAEISADNFEFTWDPLTRSGRAENVEARLANVYVSARRISPRPGTNCWTSRVRAAGATRRSTKSGPGD